MKRMILGMVVIASFSLVGVLRAEDTIAMRSASPSGPVSNSLRGSILVSGTGNFSYSRQKLTDWGWQGSYTQTTLMYGFDVRFDRPLLDHLALGCALSFMEMSSSISGSRFSDGRTSVGLMGIGPRLAYYWGDRTSTLLPYAAGEFDVFAAMGSGSGSGSNAIKAGAGVIYQLRQRVGISVEVNYYSYSNQHDITNIVGQAGLVAVLY
jgi:opacity protein-like surface antigen